jgi:uncharacterized membrane protein
LSRKTIYFPSSFAIFAILLILIVAVLAFIFVGVISVAFADVGFTPLAIILILIVTFLGSSINIPLFKLKTTIPIIKEEYASWFGVTYRIPKVEYGQAVTLVAVNVGGALIPTAVSVYLLSRETSALIFFSLIGVAVVSLVTHVMAKPVQGVGVMAPAFVPPIVAAVIALIISPSHPIAIAYISGVLGTLIGADLSNLNLIKKLGAPVASIGGAGTFDGIFLSGIIAVLLAGL